MADARKIIKIKYNISENEIFQILFVAAVTSEIRNKNEPESFEIFQHKTVN